MTHQNRLACRSLLLITFFLSGAAYPQLRFDKAITCLKTSGTTASFILEWDDTKTTVVSFGGRVFVDGSVAPNPYKGTAVRVTSTAIKVNAIAANGLNDLDILIGRVQGTGRWQDDIQGPTNRVQAWKAGQVLEGGMEWTTSAKCAAAADRQEHPSRHHRRLVARAGSSDKHQESRPRSGRDEESTGQAEPLLERSGHVAVSDILS